MAPAAVSAPASLEKVVSSPGSASEPLLKSAQVGFPKLSVLGEGYFTSTAVKIEQKLASAQRKHCSDIVSRWLVLLISPLTQPCHVAHRQAADHMWCVTVLSAKACSVDDRLELWLSLQKPASYLEHFDLIALPSLP